MNHRQRTVFKKKPVEIKNIIEKVLRHIGGEERVKESKILNSWNNIVGKTISAHTRPEKIRKGKLIVIVDSPVWKNDLERYSKQSILNNIREKIGQRIVKDINFRIGELKANGRG